MGVEGTRLKAKSFYPNDSIKKPSWILIIFMFIIFFPVGIYFLHKRVRLTRGRMSAVVITYTWSIIGTVLMILRIIDGGGIGYWIALAFFVIVWLFGLGEKIQWERYDVYIDLLMSGEWYLPIICDAVGKKQESVIVELKEMFADGIFPGSYINMSDLTVMTDYSCLAKMGLYPPKLKPMHVPDDTPVTSSNAKIVVRCKGCGANAEGVVGKTGTCEYCDSPISFM